MTIITTESPLLALRFQHEDDIPDYFTGLAVVGNDLFLRDGDGGELSSNYRSPVVDIDGFPILDSNGNVSYDLGGGA